MSDWNVNLSDVASCKLDSSNVSNIYDKVGSKYRLLWPHPGVTVESDISSNFTWDSVSFTNEYSGITGTTTNNILKALDRTDPNSPVGTFYILKEGQDWYNDDETVIKAGTYTAKATYNGPISTGHIMEDLRGDALFTWDTVTIPSGCVWEDYFLANIDLTYNGEGYNYDYLPWSNGYPHLGLWGAIRYVTAGYYSSTTGEWTYYTGTIRHDYYNQNMIDPGRTTCIPFSAATGDTIHLAAQRFIDWPGKDEEDWANLKTITLPSGGITVGTYAYDYWEETVSFTRNGTCTLSSDMPFGTDTTLTYTFDATIPTSSTGSLVFTIDPVTLYNPHGKHDYIISPVSGTATLPDGIPEGYVAYTTAETYVLNLSTGGSITTVGSSVPWYYDGVSVTRLASNYSFTPYTYSSTSIYDPLADPTVLSTTVTTMTTKKKVDYI